VAVSTPSSPLTRSDTVDEEEIVIAIEDGSVIDIVKHTDPDRYQNQLIYLIDYRNYIWAVPHIVDKENGEIFLKTIYPSRRLTRKYRGGEEDAV